MNAQNVMEGACVKQECFKNRKKTVALIQKEADEMTLEHIRRK